MVETTNGSANTLAQIRNSETVERPWIENGGLSIGSGYGFVDIKGDLGIYRDIDNPIVEIFRAAEQYVRGNEQTAAKRTARILQNSVRRSTGKRFVAPVKDILAFTPVAPVYRSGVTHCEFFASNFDSMPQQEFAAIVREHLEKIKPIFDGMLSSFCYNRNGFEKYINLVSRVNEAECIIVGLKEALATNPRPELVSGHINCLMQAKNELVVECNSTIKCFIKTQGFALPKRRILAARPPKTKDQVWNLMKTTSADAVFKQIIQTA